MTTFYKFIVLLFLTIFVVYTSCKNTIDSKKYNALLEKGLIQSESFDSLRKSLESGSELSMEHIKQLKIDTAYYFKGVSAFTDTTVQINDSIFYSIISLGDKDGICSFNFILSFNEYSKNIISSKYLHHNCDNDYSNDTYFFYEHSVSRDTIDLVFFTVFQKENRKSQDHEKNIEHKRMSCIKLIVSQNGQIN